MHPTGVGADPELVGGDSGWSCMLLLHSALTSDDAGPDLCILYPDLCTLCLWWLSPAATYDGGVSPSAVGTNTLLKHVVASPIAACTVSCYCEMDIQIEIMGINICLENKLSTLT